MRCGVGPSMGVRVRARACVREREGSVCKELRARSCVQGVCVWERVCACVMEYMPLRMECLRASACAGCVHACARAMSARACERPCLCEGAGRRAGASAHAWVHARVLRVGECCVCARVLVCMLAYMCSGRTCFSPGCGWACTGAHVLRASTGVCARVCGVKSNSTGQASKPATTGNGSTSSRASSQQQKQNDPHSKTS